jgi:broad specificity phosphatase PhoE
MKLFLVRHGETKENEAGVLMGHHHGILTEKGKAQARETALSLKDYKLDHIYSSDLNRCVDTAEFIKEFHPDTPLTFTKELRERNLGNLQGQKSASVDWDGLPGDGDRKKPEGGESIAELKARALNFVRQAYKQHPNDSILLVSHNGWIKQIVSHFTGVHSKDVAKVGNAQIIKVEIGENMTGKNLKS